MELYKNAYFGKSFMMIGDELPHCFKCTYCRANDGKGLSFHTLPTEINPLFTDIPVAVNCFYGDPMLQIDNTLRLLSELEKSNHKGPVFIITKGDISRLDNAKFNLDLHIGLSTCGLGAEKYDGGDFNRFINNLNYCKENGYIYHIEFRPIIKNINDSDDSFNAVINLAKAHNVGIGYCGLQVSDNLRKRLKQEGVEFEPYDKSGFGLKKHISPEIETKFRDMAHSHDVNVFKKTSCIVSTLRQERDYNAHYYRPNEVGCIDCPNRQVCESIHQKNNSFVFSDWLNDVIPFDFEVIDAKDHCCTLYKNGLCNFPSHDCMHINGKLIKIDTELTTTDVRIIKWMTGYTVDAKFTELPYISQRWKI